jgi:pentatricopeptide repeat protein
MQRFGRVFSRLRAFDFETHTRVFSIKYELIFVTPLRRAMELVSEMTGRGAELSQYTFGSLIEGFCRAGQLENAFEWFRRFLQRDFELTELLCNKLITGCARIGNVAKALEVLEIMKERSIPPSIFTFNVLIDACDKAQDVDMAFKVRAKLNMVHCKSILTSILLLVD